MSFLLNLFKRDTPLEQSLRPKPPRQAVTASSGNLYQEEAVAALLTSLTRMPDMDEVLTKAGVTRDRLRVLMYDDEIFQACETRLDALIATPLRVEPSEHPDSEKVMKLAKPHLVNIISTAWRARLYGYTVMEAVYKRTPDGIGFNFIGEKPLQWFEPKSDGRLIYYPDDGSAGSEGVEVDQKYKFFLTRCNATYEYPYGEALLSRLYWPWYYRTSGWKFWGKFLERFGSPLLVGKSEDPAAMVATLLAAHSQAVMGVDREDDVESVGMHAGNNGQAFDSFEAAVIRRIQKVVLGQTLTSGTDAGSGNRALGTIHDKVRVDKRNSDILMVTPTLQCIFDALCELNGLAKVVVTYADEVGLG